MQHKLLPEIENNWQAGFKKLQKSQKRFIIIINV